MRQRHEKNRPAVDDSLQEGFADAQHRTVPESTAAGFITQAAANDTSSVGLCDCNSGHAIVNAKNSFRITRKTRFLKKAGFPDLSGKNFYHIQILHWCSSAHYRLHPPAAKPSENENTSGNRYMAIKVS
jgi:hypothetical protein